MANKNWIVLPLFFPVFLYAQIGIQRQTAAPYVSSADLMRTATELEHLGRYELAANHYIRLLQNSPTDLTGYLGAKRTLVRLHDYDRLELVIRSLQQNRRELRYQVDLGELDYLRGEPKKALATWDQLLEDNSKSHEAYTLIGAVLVEHQEYHKAKDVLLRARQVFKAPQLFIFELANIYGQIKAYRSMVQEYIRFLDFNPHQVQFVEAELVQYLVQDQSDDTILEELNAFLKTESQHRLQIHQILASLHAGRKQFDLALLHAMAVEELTPKPGGGEQSGYHLYQIAQLAYRNNAIEQARSAYQMILQRFPKSSFALQSQLGLAQIYQSDGKFQQAIQSFLTFSQQYPQSPEAIKAKIVAGELLLNNLNNPKEAEKVFQSLFRDYPGSLTRYQALLRIGDCAVAQNDLDRAILHYRSVQKETRDKNRALFEEASWLLLQALFYGGDFEALREAFTQTSSPENQSGSPNIYENDALKLAFLLLDAKNDSSALFEYGRAQLLFVQKQYEAARDRLLSITSVTSPMLRDEIGLLLSKTYENLEQYGFALERLEAIEKNVNSLYRDEALYRMAALYETKIKDMNQAKEMYEMILTHFPDSIYLEQARSNVRALEARR